MKRTEGGPVGLNLESIKGGGSKGRGRGKRGKEPPLRRRKSGVGLEEGWGESNIRVVDPAMQLDMKMPEIHHGIALSSLPVPLNKVIQKWNNVPKLYQYLPSEIEVVYHRATGEEERVTGAKGYSSSGDDESLLQGENSTPPSTPKKKEVVIGEREDEITSSYVRKLEGLPKMNGNVPSSLDHRLPSERKVQALPELKNKEAVSLTTASIQTDMTVVKNNTVQASVERNSLQCQTEESIVNKVVTSDSSSQASVQTVANSCQAFIEEQQVNSNSEQRTKCIEYSHMSSQTEPLSCRNNSSQSDFIESPKRLAQSLNVETQCQVSIREQNVQVQSHSVDVECQTEVDIESPKICLDCNFKQLQVEELEEQMDDLKKSLKSKELEELMRKGSFVDMAVNTEAQQEVPSPKEQQKLLALKKENEHLRLTVQSLNNQLQNFQLGLTRLRTAIEKPIPGKDGLSEKAITEVIQKADRFLTDHSISRAEKIQNHLSVLSSCVTVANGILEEDAKK